MGSVDWMTYKEPTIYMEYNDEYGADRLEAVSESDIEDIKITKKHPNPFLGMRYNINKSGHTKISTN